MKRIIQFPFLRLLLVGFFVSLLLQGTCGSDDASASSSSTSSGTPSTAEDVVPTGRDCVLPCENNGICEFVVDSLQDRQAMVQASMLLQRCRCPTGWGGVVCEIPTETCNLETKTCTISGRPCDRIEIAKRTNTSNNSTTNTSLKQHLHPTAATTTKTIEYQWTCHCGVADRVDANLAGAICRNGYTEYCNPHPYQFDQPFYFCTNGGKCNTDYLVVEEEPGDLQVRQTYMDTGCHCPSRYYQGQYCEKLIFDPQEHLPGLVDPARGFFPTNDNNDTDVSSSSSPGGKMPAGGIIILVFVLAALVFSVALLIRMRYHDRHPSSNNPHKSLSAASRARYKNRHLHCSLGDNHDPREADDDDQPRPPHLLRVFQPRKSSGSSRKLRQQQQQQQQQHRHGRKQPTCYYSDHKKNSLADGERLCRRSTNSKQNPPTSLPPSPYLEEDPDYFGTAQITTNDNDALHKELLLT